MMRPFLSGPTATEKMMTSRSSPCTFSMYLTRMGSFVWLRSKWASGDGSLRRAWFPIRRCWSPLNVTTPIDCDAGIRRRTAGRRFTGAGFCHFRSPLVRPQRVTSGRSSLLMQLATPHQAAGDVGCLQ